MKTIKKIKQLTNYYEYSHYYITDSSGTIAYTNGKIMFVEDTFDMYEDRKSWNIHQVTKNPPAYAGNMNLYPNITKVIAEVHGAVEIGRVRFDSIVQNISYHTFKQSENASLLLLPNKRFIIADQATYAYNLDEGGCIIRGEHTSVLADPIRINLFYTEYMNPNESILWRFSDKNPILTTHYEAKNGRTFTVYIATMDVEEKRMNPEISAYIKEVIS